MKPSILVPKYRQLVYGSESGEQVSQVLLIPVFGNLPDEQLDRVIVLLVCLCDVIVSDVML